MVHLLSVNVDEAEFQSTQPWYMQWLQWSCKDDCDYHCMWHTVEELRQNNDPVPQFHGKVSDPNIYMLSWGGGCSSPPSSSGPAGETANSE